MKNYYKSLLNKADRFFFERDIFVMKRRHFFARIVIMMLLEPFEVLKVSFRMPKGHGTLNKYGLNPVQLTEIQAQYPPILCIHGNYHNQSAWLSLAKHFKKEQYPGPIYTLNLPSGYITPKDMELINQKIKFIMNSYKEANVPEDQFKLNLIGHSRGVNVILNYSDKNPSIINHTILIGSDRGISKTDPKKSYINGSYDASISKSSFEKTDDRHFVFDVGHIGLISEPNVLKICHSIMVDSSSSLKVFQEQQKESEQEVIETGLINEQNLRFFSSNQFEKNSNVAVEDEAVLTKPTYHALGI